MSSKTPKTNTGDTPTQKKTGKQAATKKVKPPTPTRPDEMSAEVIEFITAIDDYKRARGRPFPNWSEVLEIVKGLGYAKQS